MKRGKGYVRSPKGSRRVMGEGKSRNVSVGSALRAAKRDLFVKRFFLLLAAVIIVSVLAILIFSGYFGTVFHTVIDYLM